MADEKNKIHVMSREETENYAGETIEADSGQPQDKPRYEQDSFFEEQQKINDLFTPHRVTLKDLLWNNLSWKNRLLLIGGGVALIAFGIFVALPALAFLVGAAAIAWLLMQFFIR